MTKTELENLLKQSDKWYVIETDAEGGTAWVDQPSNYHIVLTLLNEGLRVYMEGQSSVSSMFNNASFTIPYDNLKTEVLDIHCWKLLTIASYEYLINFRITLDDNFLEGQEKTA